MKERKEEKKERQQGEGSRRVDEMETTVMPTPKCNLLYEK